MKRFCLCVLAAAVLVLAPASSARADHIFFIVLTGDQEVPPVPTGAFGFGILALSDDLTTLDFAFFYAGLEGGAVVGAHFHNAPPGQDGDVVRGYDSADFGSPDGYVAASWTKGDPESLTSAMVEQIFLGNIYFNIHTEAYGGGEIRGQVYYLFSF
jgi:CHRD domain